MTQITILAYGTRGDVQPAIALGKTLQERGHGVRLLASSHYGEWINSHGLEAAATEVDIHQVMRSEMGQEWAERGTNPLVQSRLMKRLLERFGEKMARDSWEGSQDAGAIISSFTSDVLAASIAERLDIPHISMPLQPVLFPTRNGRAVMNAPLPRQVSIVNYLFSRFILQGYPWQMLGEINNRMRRQLLGLPAQSERENLAARKRMLTVIGYSRHVVPHPPDWPDNVYTTGYWFLDEEEAWTPPAALEAFMEAGPPPVYIGFGSMTGRDPAALTQLLLEAIERSEQRALLFSGWAGLGGRSLPDTVFHLEQAPHSWLFPRVSAVVHHGGAGTTAAGLRAGRPTVIVAHLGDQKFWGRRVADLGAGPEPIMRPNLSAEKLAEAIRTAVYEPTMLERAFQLGAAIRAEDGRAYAADLIDDWIS